MSDNNRDQQFQMTPAAIEERRNALQQLPLEELNEMFRIQEGRDSSDDPQPAVGRVSRADKKKLIDRIMEHRARNYHPTNEERYQFVLWLYRIRTQYPQMGLFQPDFIWVIFRKMMPSKYNRRDSDIKKAVNAWCEDPRDPSLFPCMCRANTHLSPSTVRWLCVIFLFSFRSV